MVSYERIKAALDAVTQAQIELKSAEEDSGLNGCEPIADSDPRLIAARGYLAAVTL